MKHFTLQYILKKILNVKGPLWCGLFLLLLLSCGSKSGYFVRFVESQEISPPAFSATGVSSGVFTFSFVGDIHLGGSDTGRLRTVLQAAQDNGDAFVIFLGDMVDKGERADFDTFKAQVREFGFENKAIYVIGNHDVFGEGWDAYKKIMGPSHFDLTVGNCRFLVLDSADGMVGEEQTQWLEETLKQRSSAHTLVLSHYMPLVPGQRTYLRLSNEIEAIHLMKMISRLGVEAWLGGHYHSYAQEKIDNVTYLVAGGGGGRRMEPLKELFYVRATVNGPELTFQVHTF
jgi:predicted phosphodiesterase